MKNECMRFLQRPPRSFETSGKSLLPLLGLYQIFYIFLYTVYSMSQKPTSNSSLILTLRRYRRGTVYLIVRCTYFIVTAKHLNFGLYPWKSVHKILLRIFSTHSEICSMTSSVTSSHAKNTPKTSKNTPPLKNT